MEMLLPFPPSANHYWRHVGPRTLISREGRTFRTNVCALLGGGGPRKPPAGGRSLGVNQGAPARVPKEIVFGEPEYTKAVALAGWRPFLSDRLTHRVHILEANGESFRLRDSRRRLTGRTALHQFTESRLHSLAAAV